MSEVSNAFYTMTEDNLRKSLTQAVQTVQQACEDALCAIEHNAPANAVQEVLRTLAWGQANAIASITGAMAKLDEDRHTIRAAHGSSDEAADTPPARMKP